ncbi:hypothetical protein BST61_g11256 [Cercospora zeina]
MRAEVALNGVQPNRSTGPSPSFAHSTGVLGHLSFLLESATSSDRIPSSISQVSWTAVGDPPTLANNIFFTTVAPVLPRSSDATMDYIVPFIVRRASTIDPAWNPRPLDAAFAKKRSQKRAALLASTPEQTNTWKRFLRDFTRESKERCLARFDIDKLRSLEDVQLAADAALKSYEDKGTLRHNPVRAMGRSVGNNVSSFEAFVQLLSSNEYTSVACGVLTLLFTAASEVQKAGLMREPTSMF